MTPGRAAFVAATDARTALLTYAREYTAGELDRREHEVQALLAALRPDRSPMWRWGTFMRVASTTSTLAERDRALDELASGGGT